MKIRQTFLMLMLLTTFASCKVRNTPRYKTYDINHAFTNIKGLDVPVFTEDKKVFVMTKEVKRDIKHSILGTDLSDEGTRRYEKEKRDHLIKTISSPNGWPSYNDFYNASNLGEIQRTYSFDGNNDITYISSHNKKEIYFGNKTVNPLPNPDGSTAAAIYDWYYSYYPGNRLRGFGSKLDYMTIGNTSLNFGMPIGKYYLFDKSGGLIVSIDFEENFRMDFAELTARVLASREWLVEKYKNNFTILLIKRNSNNLGSFWVVACRAARTQKEVHLVIDDATGKIVGHYDLMDPELSKYTEIPSDRKNALEKMRNGY